MKKRYGVRTLILCGCLWLSGASHTFLNAQGTVPSRGNTPSREKTPYQATMQSVVNSEADDTDSHPYDDPNTPDIDESVDGICRDAQGRCTLRAALEEAAALNEAAEITFAPSV